jgi:pimeloyl-ACP methyl ester carboxylesterase/uncharacterized membrane protein YbhN (UPF0104 family)
MSITITSSAPASGSGRRAARVAAAALAAAVLGGAATRERDNIAASLTFFGHLNWLWIPVAIALEGASMVAFASLQRRLLATGGASVGVATMLGTSLAANALSVSIPLAGPELAAAFTFRRYTQHGADAPLAGWSLLAGGVISAATAAFVVLGGGLTSGNVLATGIAVPGGVLAIAGLLALGAAARRPRFTAALGRRATWLLKPAGRLLRRPAGDPAQIIRVWANRLASLQLGSSGWMTVTGLGMVNWLADAAVLVVSIRAVGGPVPWNDLLVVYGSGIAAQGLNITPGGLGVAEGAMSLALVVTGLRASQALAAVLLYRLASFRLVAVTGWLVLLLLRHPRLLQQALPWRNKPVQQTAGEDAMAADHELGTIAWPALSSHELVLLHGQPGSPADWDQVGERLPPQLRAVAAARPGYGTNPLPAGGLAANAHALISDLNARRIDRAVLVGHSYGGGIALSAARIVPDRVEAVVLLASVGPGCINIWDRVLAAPVTGPACALMAWKLTPWIARARLAAACRSASRSLRPDDYVNWRVWGQGDNARGTLWRTFLIEQRALLRDVSELERALPSIAVPALVIADPRDAIVGAETALRLAKALPNASLCLVSDAGHHLPRRAPSAVANAITAFLTALDAEQPVAAVPESCDTLARTVPA